MNTTFFSSPSSNVTSKDVGRFILVTLVVAYIIYSLYYAYIGIKYAIECLRSTISSFLSLTRVTEQCPQSLEDLVAEAAARKLQHEQWTREYNETLKRSEDRNRESLKNQKVHEASMAKLVAYEAKERAHVSTPTKAVPVRDLVKEAENAAFWSDYSRAVRSCYGTTRSRPKEDDYRRTWEAKRARGGLPTVTEKPEVPAPAVIPVLLRDGFVLGVEEALPVSVSESTQQTATHNVDNVVNGPVLPPPSTAITSLEANTADVEPKVDSGVSALPAIEPRSVEPKLVPHPPSSTVKSDQAPNAKLYEKKTASSTQTTTSKIFLHSPTQDDQPQSTDSSSTTSTNRELSPFAEELPSSDAGEMKTAATASAPTVVEKASSTPVFTSTQPEIRTVAQKAIASTPHSDPQVYASDAQIVHTPSACTFVTAPPRAEGRAATAKKAEAYSTCLSSHYTSLASKLKNIGPSRVKASLRVRRAKAVRSANGLEIISKPLEQPVELVNAMPMDVDTHTNVVMADEENSMFAVANEADCLEPMVVDDESVMEDIVHQVIDANELSARLVWPQMQLAVEDVEMGDAPLAQDGNLDVDMDTDSLPQPQTFFPPQGLAASSTTGSVDIDMEPQEFSTLTQHIAHSNGSSFPSWPTIPVNVAAPVTSALFTQGYQVTSTGVLPSSTSTTATNGSTSLNGVGLVQEFTALSSTPDLQVSAPMAISQPNRVILPESPAVPASSASQSTATAVPSVKVTTLPPSTSLPPLFTKQFSGSSASTPARVSVGAMGSSNLAGVDGPSAGTARGQEVPGQRNTLFNHPATRPHIQRLSGPAVALTNARTTQAMAAPPLPLSTSPPVAPTQRTAVPDPKQIDHQGVPAGAVTPSVQTPRTLTLDATRPTEQQITSPPPAIATQSSSSNPLGGADVDSKPTVTSIPSFTPAVSLQSGLSTAAAAQRPKLQKDLAAGMFIPAKKRPTGRSNPVAKPMAITGSAQQMSVKDRLTVGTSTQQQQQLFTPKDYTSGAKASTTVTRGQLVGAANDPFIKIEGNSEVNGNSSASRS